MSTKSIAEVTTVIHDTIERVWRALVDPEMIASYMMGTNVTTDRKEGSPITWKGEWKGKAYEDSGELIIVREPELFKYTHVSGADPEQAHTVTVELKEVGGVTHLHLTQDNNLTEESRRESEKNWTAMFDGLKKALGEAPVSKPEEART